MTGEKNWSIRTGDTKPSGFTASTEQGSFLSTRSAVFPMSSPAMPVPGDDVEKFGRGRQLSLAVELPP